jgi:pimeloyl-ACP methyl ester carboxylesterase
MTAKASIDSLVEHHLIKTNGVTLHVVTAGPADGEPVILLHGFPEFWYGWRHQIPALVEAGYRVIVPDQRGYNQSDKPQGIENYTLDKLAADVVGLMDALGYRQVYLVGHDWGAVVAWSVGIMYPERLKRLTIMNVPHPSVFQRYVRSNLRQMLKSWYVFSFQMPVVPEWLFAMGGYSMGVRAIKGSGKPDTFSDDDMERYREAWAHSGALTGMINWYRAIVQKPPKLSDNVRVRVPTLVIWGKQDAFLSAEMAQLSVEMCDDGQLVMIDDATHWVQHDAAEQVNSLLLGFFRHR